MAVLHQNKPAMYKMRYHQRRVTWPALHETDGSAVQRDTPNSSSKGKGNPRDVTTELFQPLLQGALSAARVARLHQPLLGSATPITVTWRAFVPPALSYIYSLSTGLSPAPPSGYFLGLRP